MHILSNENLKKLLTEYSRKREKAIQEATDRKDLAYSKNPKLRKIDAELSKCAFSSARLLLNGNDSIILENLKNKIATLKNEKMKLLKEMNVDFSSFSPKYECTVCNDTGYITTNNVTSMCPCLKQRLYDLEFNSYNIYSLKDETFDNFNYNVYSDISNSSEYNSSISPRENIQIIRNICNNFISNFDNPSEKNLLFSGKPGLGKTFLSNCIANELVKEGKLVLYQTAPIMLDSIINYRLRKSRGKF